MLAARRAAWDAAFTALFQQLRNGTTDAFYCVSPQVHWLLQGAYIESAMLVHQGGWPLEVVANGCLVCNPVILLQNVARRWHRHSRLALSKRLQCQMSILFGLLQDTRKTAFVALFRTAGLGSCGEPHALVSRSSAGLRALLRAEAVPFAMPLAAAGSEEAEAATAALLADVEANNLGKVCLLSGAELDQSSITLLIRLAKRDADGSSAGQMWRPATSARWTC